MTLEEDIATRSRRRSERATARRFSSLDEENRFERERWRALGDGERRAELAALKERAFGSGWTKRPIEKVWSWEIVDWV